MYAAKPSALGKTLEGSFQTRIIHTRLRLSSCVGLGSAVYPFTRLRLSHPTACMSFVHHASTSDSKHTPLAPIAVWMFSMILAAAVLLFSVFVLLVTLRRDDTSQERPLGHCLWDSATTQNPDYRYGQWEVAILSQIHTNHFSQFFPVIEPNRYTPENQLKIIMKSLLGRQESRYWSQKFGWDEGHRDNLHW